MAEKVLIPNTGNTFFADPYPKNPDEVFQNVFEMLEQYKLDTKNACSCNVCKSMCIRPCFGTPPEMLHLVENGLADHLYIYRVPQEYHNDSSWNMIIPKMWNKKCIFQDSETRLCMLHDLNAKPLEGRLARCEDPTYLIIGISNRTVIERTWNSNQGQNAVKQFIQAG